VTNWPTAPGHCINTFDQLKREMDRQEEFQEQLHRILAYALHWRLNPKTQRHWTRSIVPSPILPSYDDLRRFLTSWIVFERDSGDFKDQINYEQRQGVE